ncbi:MAG: anti-sigma factor [Phycisphaerales bacterium]|nr:MAG: anti-sigma factor [Phycisphaerales bacterium]
MISRTSDRYERLQDLLTDRAIEGLGIEEQLETQQLLREYPDVDADAFDRTLAMLDVGQNPAVEPVPAELLDRLHEQADRWCDLNLTDPSHTTPELTDQAASQSSAATKSAGSHSFLSWGGWLAAAACLLIALFAWMPGTSNSPNRAMNKLVQSAPDLMMLNWDATDDPAAEAGVSGEVFWSSARQEGYMRIRNLKMNDPNVEQYQLWIFDQNRPEATPVDGGVFDIDREGEVVIPIRAKLPVEKPVMFAVTVEQPGGVVVSNRDRIPILAQVNPGPCEDTN